MGTAVDKPLTGSVPATPIFDPEKVFALWCSYGDLRTLSGKDKARVVRLLQTQGEPLADYIGKIITVEHVLVHNVDMVNQETGEVNEATRLVLIASDETAYTCVSEGIRRSIGLLAQAYGMPPWTGGMRAKVEQLTTRRGRRTFILTPVE